LGSGTASTGGLFGLSGNQLGGGIGALGSVVGGIGSFITAGDTAAAYQAEAQGFDLAANYAQTNASLSAEVGGLQALADARKFQAYEGREEAAAGASGLRISGSVSSVIRDSVRQGYLQQGMVGINTAIAVTNYEQAAAADKAQAQAARDNASAAQSSGTFGLLGGILGGVTKLFGLF
jgi:hypothetical protein